MKNSLIQNSSPIVYILAAGLCASPAIADWSGNQSYRSYNQGYGDFPPVDIEEQLFGKPDTGEVAEENAPKIDSQPGNAAPATNNNQPVSNPAPNYSQQNYQYPAYNRYAQGRRYAPSGRQNYNRNTGFNGPWNNNGSSFSGPWNNRGSNFSGPWNNNGSSFSGPWNSNGSGFNAPWGNNGSNFSPWGNGGGWSW